MGLPHFRCVTVMDSKSAETAARRWGMVQLAQAACGSASTAESLGLSIANPDRGKTAVKTAVRRLPARATTPIPSQMCARRDSNPQPTG